MRRSTASALLALCLVGGAAAPALACAGLVAPNGSVRLTRTATFAGYHDRIEHYVTSFQFQGGGAKFGSITPLPDIPSKVTRGGDWTLQRLQQETTPPQPTADSAGSAEGPAARNAEELYETEIDGLRITILRGGSRAVGRWAKKEGFALSPDAPEVLRFYAKRSKIFMAARFVPEKAEEEQLESGDGVPIHLRIPTDNPWVPLRILALGKRPRADITADVYLLTHGEPTLLPTPVSPGERGLIQERSEQASKDLLDDLRSDKGMKWIPSKMWLTYLRVDSNAGKLTYDLSVGTKATGPPSHEEAFGVQQDSVGSDEQTSSTEPILLYGWLLVPALGFGSVKLVRTLARKR